MIVKRSSGRGCLRQRIEVGEVRGDGVEGGWKKVVMSLLEKSRVCNGVNISYLDWVARRKRACQVV